MRFATLSLALLTLLPASVWCVTVDFSILATGNTPQLVLTDFSVTGSANIQTINLNGLGVVGGISDFVVDGSEWIQFTFTGAPATGVSYFVSAAGNQNGTGGTGDRILEAFDALGNSLGSVAQGDSGAFAVSSLFGNVALSGFRLTANVDSIIVRSLTYESQIPVRFRNPPRLPWPPSEGRGWHCSAGAGTTSQVTDARVTRAIGFRALGLSGPRIEPILPIGGVEEECPSR